MKNCTLRLLFMICFGIYGLQLNAQFTPSCRSMELPVAIDDSATIFIADVIPNSMTAVPFIFEIQNPYGGIIVHLTVTDPTTSFRIAACQYLGRQLLIRAQNNFGSCSSNITFKEFPNAIILGNSTTVYCNDSLILGGVIGQGPVAFVPCSANPEVSYVADWVVTYPCDLDQDTAKVIYREYAATGKNGIRATGFDTIVVLRLPLVSLDNTFCGLVDTTYCDQPDADFGPFMLIENPVTLECDTLRFLKPDGTPNTFDAKCGLLVTVDVLPFPGDCGIMQKYVVQIKQICYSGIDTGCPSQDNPDNVLVQETATPGYWSCTFWHLELDTVPPVVNCGADTLTVSTNAHGCSAHLVLPPVTAYDLCSNIKSVKAIVEGQGTIILNVIDSQWVSSQSFKLPFSNEPVRVIYEAIDDCHNIGYDTCYLLVSDQTLPIAVSHKKLNISLSGKKTWVDAGSFDESSWDNCEIAITLARRSDWQEACINLCDSLTLVAETPDGPIWTSVPSGNELENPVAAHYRNTLQWLELDGGDCNQLLREAWRYDLMKYATIECKETMEASEFDQAVIPFINAEVDIVQVRQLGGGWSDQVPFSCDDVCGVVTVELLIMDYWCNWNTTWSNVLVEDKTAVSVAKEVTEDLEISCKIFAEERYMLDGSLISTRDLIEAATLGDAGASAQIDEIFGTYSKAWRTDQGEIVDSAGQVLECDIPFVDSMCVCVDVLATLDIFDPHLGWITRDTTIRYCYYEVVRDTFSHGAIAVNCSENTHCTQSLWYSLDECSQGVVYRKWKIWKECINGDTSLAMQTPDTTYRLQRIWVGNNCPLDPGMFLLPGDTVLQACEIEYDPDGSGNVGGGLHPDSLGKPLFLFDDDCRQVGIGYFDKVLEAVDTSECDVVMRTWCFADWCSVDKQLSDDWILENTLFKHIQFIHVCKNLCSLDCTNLRDTVISCVDIPSDVTDLYSFFNTPLVVSADTSIVCEVTLENQISIDTNSCGFGSIRSIWYLVDVCDTRIDSCQETIMLLSDSITIRNGRSYFGDAEPFNCSDSMILDPVEIMGACPKLGLFTVTNDSPYPGNNASGNYEVGVYYINYTISSACLDTIYLTDTVTVIDDVDPLVFAFSDPCVNLMEWVTDFDSNPLHPDIRTKLGVDATDNCEVDTILLISLDSMFFPDALIRDSVLYTYKWQSRDTFGNLSMMATSTILVSDSCEVNQAMFIYDVNNQLVQAPDRADRLMIPFDHNDDEDRLLKIGLSNNQANTGEFQLYQNRPNPFRSETTIGFLLPESTSAIISVFDLTGRRIKVIEGEYQKGYHEIDLLQSDFNSTGILYYRFDSVNFTAMRKMIIVE